jgi:hypothetical protein
MHQAYLAKTNALDGPFEAYPGDKVLGTKEVNPPDSLDRKYLRQSMQT